MLNTTKGKYQKSNTTYTNVASPQSQDDIKQVQSLFEDGGNLKYKLDDETIKAIVNFSETAPTMNGIANAGESNTVSRGDHTHPSDTTKANTSDLTSGAITVKNATNSQFSQYASTETFKGTIDIRLDNSLKINLSKVRAKVELSRFNVKTWNGFASFEGELVWTDGKDIYYSSSTNHYVLDIATSTWSIKDWVGLTDFDGFNIWTDGTKIYYSSGTEQYVINNPSISTWSTKEWTGLTDFYGHDIWSDGANIYYSYNDDQYILNKNMSAWGTKSWDDFLIVSFDGYNVWTDGMNIYRSRGTEQKELKNSEWFTKNWVGLTNFYGQNIWTDGINVYYSNGTDQYVLGIEK